MSQPSCARRVTGDRPELSTRTSLFSTPFVEALQLRDVNFVSSRVDRSYRGTGADSRARLASAPAFPSMQSWVSSTQRMFAMRAVHAAQDEGPVPARARSLLSPHSSPSRSSVFATS